MWIIKHIYESDFGCEERIPGEPLKVLVVLESDTGEVLQAEVADQWLTLMDLDEGDEWPEDLINQEIETQNKFLKQSEWIDTYMAAVDEMEQD